MPDPDLSEKDINAMLKRVWQQNADVNRRVKVWRSLINRVQAGISDSELGTLIPPPWHNSLLTFKAMSAAPMKATIHYTARISGNKPDFKVVPLSEKETIGSKVDKIAGEQERLDAHLWESMGGLEAQKECSWSQTTDGVGYLHVMPRDATFGLPDRIYLEDSDETSLLVKLGRLSPAKRVTVQGKVMYAEAGDVWAARRKQVAKQHAIDGESLFVLKAYSRDMVLVERDADGISWAAITEDISADKVGPGTDVAKSAARIAKDIDESTNIARYGLIYQQGKIIAGVNVGVPVGTGYQTTLTMTKLFTRMEQIILVGGQGSPDSGRIVYRGNHGCTVRGVPTVPVFEVPFMRTNTRIPGMEFATPLSEVMAHVPRLNQLESLMSNADALNLTPRWVVELKDGTILRGEDGEPVIISQEQTPGLDPSQAAAYPGTLRQLTVEVVNSIEMIKIIHDEIREAMPSEAAQGQGGTSEAAWHAQLMIEQDHQNLQQPVDNQAAAAKEVIQACHGWLRQLDTPVYFYPMSNFKADARPVRALVEVDPGDLTDSIVVNQEIADPQATIIAIQVGSELYDGGKIDFREFASEYMKVQDPREAEIRKYAQLIKDHVVGGIPAPPNSLIALSAQAAFGQLSYEMMKRSANYMITTAEGMVAQAGMMGQPYAQDPNAPQGEPQQGDVAQAAGVRQPGMGMAPTLQGQLGSGALGAVPSVV